MNNFLRFRHLLLIGGSILSVFLLYYTDPEHGSITSIALMQIVTSIIAVWFAHLSRKALFDYIDMNVLYKKAKETATGAGLTFLGVCIVILGLLGLFGGQVHAAEALPEKAYTHLPLVVAESQKLWPTHPK